MRESYNGLIRSAYTSHRLVDIAAIESTTPDGGAWGALYPGYKHRRWSFESDWQRPWLRAACCEHSLIRGPEPKRRERWPSERLASTWSTRPGLLACCERRTVASRWFTPPEIAE